MSNRCLYHSSFHKFLHEDPSSIYSSIRKQYHGGSYDTTDDAWDGEIEILQRVLLPWENENAHIIFEYDIPRLGKRIDVVLLLRGLIFCLEFKVGKKKEELGDIDQVLDYALDLKNFHLYSKDVRIVPILIPTKFKDSTKTIQFSVYNDGVYNPLVTGEDDLQDVIARVIQHGQQSIDPSKWGNNWLISPYSPTPTIIEAARTLYEDHTVEDIKRCESDEVLTERTIQFLLSVIEKSKQEKQKSICFVTGVPGAGKTLVGLEVAIKQTYKDGDIVNSDKAVYLSGNSPLVAVLSEALAQNNKERNKGKNLTDSRREVSEFIQAIHRYRDNMLAKIKNPVENGIVEIDENAAIENGSSGFGEVEHVAIFDEAQRSWTQERLARYLKNGGTYGNKIRVPNFPLSEAAFLIWSLDQRKDWAVIICLVGGGQEIHTGEAGIGEWIVALNTMFPHWNVYISNKLDAPEYAEGRVNELLKDNPNVINSDKLHLAVNLRSFRAERLSDFVHSVLTFDNTAKQMYKAVSDKYPLLITRDINKARGWLSSKARGSERIGMLVSKEAGRYQPQAITILESDKEAVRWFLADKTDVHSSNYLEDALTEIRVQGLELDYTCVLWEADVRRDHNAWRFHIFNGKNKWKETKDDVLSNYMINAYRVLLTRARQGMIICVPEGNPKDPTRLPEFYDSTYRYLKSLGIEEI